MRNHIQNVLLKVLKKDRSFYFLSKIKGLEKSVDDKNSHKEINMTFDEFVQKVCQVLKKERAELPDWIMEQLERDYKDFQTDLEGKMEIIIRNLREMWENC